jgi:hypothetical protein
MISCKNKALAVNPKARLLSGTATTALAAIPVVISLGVTLAQPAQAQSVIGQNHYASVNLSTYGNSGQLSINTGTVIAPTFGDAIIGNTGSAWSLSNAGAVNAASGSGILLNAAGSVANQATGTVTASNYGVRVENGAGSVGNAGLIAAGYDGVSLNRGGAVSNALGGTITGGHIGIYTGNGAGDVANAGVINARTGDAVSLYNGGNFSNAATGQVTGGYSGVYAGGNGGSISNAGALSGTEFGVYLAGAGNITNTGSIGGGIDGVIDVAQNGVVENSGVINGGKIGLRIAADGQVMNAGTITGGNTGVKLGNGGMLTNAAGGLIQGGDTGLIAGTNAVILNAGTILDATVAGAVLGRGDVLDNTGAIGGITGVQVNGGATIFNAGIIASTVAGDNAIAFTGGASSLTLSTGSVITGNIDGGETASDIALVGTGVLTSNLNNFGAGSALDVAQGADWTASGNWNVAQVANSGVFQPGVAGTALDLTGNFTQTAAGTTRVLVSPSGTTEFNITGAAQLSGNLEYVLAPGAYAPETDTFLTASNGVTGSFANVTVDAPAAQTPVETAPAATAPAVTAPAAAAVVTTPVAAAPAVQSTTPAIPAALVVSDTARAASVEITERFTVAPDDDGIFAEANQAMALDADRDSDIVLGHANGQATSCPAGTLPAGAGIAGALASGFCQAGGWVEATGSKMNADAYGTTNSGFLAGLDRNIGTAKIGLAVGYDETSLNDKQGGAASVDTMRIGAYGAVPMGAVTLSASAMDGLATETTTRNSGVGNAAARMSGNVFAGAVQAAMPMQLGGLTVTPAAGLQVANVSTGGFVEHAHIRLFAVTGAASGGTTLRPYIRMAVGGNFVTASGLTVSPVASLGVTYQTGNAGGAVNLAARDGTQFAAGTPALGAAAGQVMAGISAGRGNWSVSARYSAQVSGNWSSQTVSAAFQVKF